MKYEIKLDLKKFNKTIDEIEDAIKQGTEIGLKTAAKEIKIHEQRLIEERAGLGEYEPIGYLKHSVWIMPLELTPNGASISITNVAKYAVYNEHGTGKWAEDGNGRQTKWCYHLGNGIFRFTEGMPPKHFVRDTRNIFDAKVISDIIEEQIYRLL